jgi:hypothetical protein
MIVPQGSSWELWRWCFLTMYKILDGEFNCVGVAKHLESLPGGRSKALDILAQLRRGRYHIHMLGIQTTHWEHEIAQCMGYGVRGIDTGAPIAYAQAGWKMDGVLPGRMSLYWREIANTNQEEIAEHNVEAMLGACDGI